jgi:hypothetical protein
MDPGSAVVVVEMRDRAKGTSRAATGDARTLIAHLDHGLLPPTCRRRLGLREIPRFEIEQVGDFPCQVLLTVRNRAVRQHEAPHDLRQDHLLAEIVLALQHRGEMKVVHRAPPFLLGDGDQALAGLGLQPEVARQDRLEVGPLRRGELSVGVRDLEEQRPRSQFHVFQRGARAAPARRPQWPAPTGRVSRRESLRETST